MLAQAYHSKRFVFLAICLSNICVTAFGFQYANVELNNVSYSTSNDEINIYVHLNYPDDCVAASSYIKSIVLSYRTSSEDVWRTKAFDSVTCEISRSSIPLNLINIDNGHLYYFITILFINGEIFSEIPDGYNMVANNDIISNNYFRADTSMLHRAKSSYGIQSYSNDVIKYYWSENNYKKFKDSEVSFYIYNDDSKKDYIPLFALMVEGELVKNCEEQNEPYFRELSYNLLYKYHINKKKTKQYIEFDCKDDSLSMSFGTSDIQSPFYSGGIGLVSGYSVGKTIKYHRSIRVKLQSHICDIENSKVKQCYTTMRQIP